MNKLLKKIVESVMKTVKGFKGAVRGSFKLEGRCIEKGFSLSAEVKVEVEVANPDSVDKDL